MSISVAVGSKEVLSSSKMSQVIPYEPGHQRTTVKLDGWNDGGRILTRVEYSYDDGKTWPRFVEATLHGTLTTRLGEVLSPSLWYDQGLVADGDQIKDALLPSHLRITTTPLDKPVETALTLEFVDRPSRIKLLHHSVAFDAASNSGSVVASSLSWSHAGGSGTDRAAVVSFVDDGNSSSQWSSVTYAAAAMTLQGQQTTPSWCHGEVFALTAISAGTQTVAGFVDTEVASILAAVDTEVAAIKAKTDQLTFGVTNKVDANITHVNEIEVTGNGELGTEWGPI